MFGIVRFENEYFLWGLFIILPMLCYYIYRTYQGRASINISSVDGFENSKTIRYYLRHIPFVLRCIVVFLLIFVISRPQTSEDTSSVNSEGIDVVVALDISGSMMARDFVPDRFNAAKDISAKFITDRRSDRIGLVVFAGEAFTQVPLTTDHLTLVNMLHRVEMGIIEDGTAIGNGLATAVNRLKESDAPSKVIVLLTDGVNNSGQVDPLTAAQIAADLGIRVYTVGVGSEGMAPYPAYDGWGNLVFQQAKVEIDEALLKSISQKTGGSYFRATDNTKLAEIYSQINKLEKSKVEVENFVKYYDVYHIFLLLALGLLIIEMLCRYLLFRQIP